MAVPQHRVPYFARYTKDLGTADPKSEITFTIVLKLRNEEWLKKQLQETSDPKSERYGKHLDKNEVEGMTKPSQEHFDRVADFLGSKGIQCTREGEGLKIRTSIDKTEELFHTQIHKFAQPEGKFREYEYMSIRCVRLNSYRSQANCHHHQRFDLVVVERFDKENIEQFADILCHTALKLHAYSIIIYLQITVVVKTQSKLNYLSDDIDRICLSLICKRFYQERESYLCLSTNQGYGEPGIDNFHLQSYKSVYNQSLLNIKKNYHLHIINSYLLDRFQTHTHFYLNIDKLDSDVTKVTFHIDQLDSNVEYLYKLLVDSNVTIIVDCITVQYGLPRNLKVLKFKNVFSEQLKPGCFPPTLEELTLNNEYDHPIQPNVFPSSLTNLSLGFEYCRPLGVGVLNEGLTRLTLGPNYGEQFVPGVLPSTLQHLLLISNYREEFVDGSLPPNLLTLRFISYNNAGDTLTGSMVLPSTLTSLKFVPMACIPHLSQLPNLKLLILDEISRGEEEELPLLNLKDIPTTLTKLSLFSTYRLQSAVSPLLKRLNLGECIFDVDELFPENSTYHFDRLSIQKAPEKSLIRPNLTFKSMNLLCSYELNNMLPECIESLNFGGYYRKEIHCPLPSGIKHIRLSHCDTLKCDIPQGVESLDIGGHLTNGGKIPVVVPDSVTSIIADCLPEDDAIASLPKSITNIYIRANTDEQPNSRDCHIRKLNDQYYLMVGQPYQFGFIATIFHESMFLHKILINFDIYTLFKISYSIYSYFDKNEYLGNWTAINSGNSVEKINSYYFGYEHSYSTGDDGLIQNNYQSSRACLNLEHFADIVCHKALRLQADSIILFYTNQKGKDYQLTLLDEDTDSFDTHKLIDIIKLGDKHLINDYEQHWKRGKQHMF
ncbi:hypothetical protein PPL_00776 [Heterostelium album PN500]|uniref:Peptidase S53 activation domain-containing protein n=1 Tax=Heterostelium pallidum (strain ATCC 26659 / Pp 5 / PN500) TaxID=670386 RepID=D3AXE5_HETP5|nr:hypothetical protein PPL_00776 [Heterostelium album PN500]EFA86214.1 hypothetical protein PPL_00776 [Heterostelium album PN500]|eukprot:XP_020438319.1 hypothetical protein PPL_00776 [Heterostelium album PN500]